MCMSSLPKAVTWKRTGRDSNPRPFGSRANVLLLRHTDHNEIYWAVCVVMGKVSFWDVIGKGKTFKILLVFQSRCSTLTFCLTPAFFFVVLQVQHSSKYKALVWCLSGPAPCILKYTPGVSTWRDTCKTPTLCDGRDTSSSMLRVEYSAVNTMHSCEIHHNAVNGEILRYLTLPLVTFVVLCLFPCDHHKQKCPLSGVVIDIFQKYRRYSISMPALKLSSIPISILCRKSIEIEIDTSISILL